jgi:hypothetical protein
LKKMIYGLYLRDDFKEGECPIDRTYNAIKIDRNTF